MVAIGVRPGLTTRKAVIALGMARVLRHCWDLGPCRRRRTHQERRQPTPGKGTNMNRFLTVRKSLLSGASIAIIALAVPTVAPVAQAGTLPADQIVLDGSCLSMGDVLGGGAGGPGCVCRRRPPRRSDHKQRLGACGVPPYQRRPVRWGFGVVHPDCYHHNSNHYRPAHHSSAHYRPSHYRPSRHRPSRHRPADYRPADYRPAHHNSAHHRPAVVAGVGPRASPR